MKSDRLTPAEAAELFSQSTGHIPLKLFRLKRARVLWLNERALESDPNFEKIGGSREEFEEFILDQCAFALPSEGATESGSDFIVGYADRYGGDGIGQNGGSGRAAIINGYHVKGIGRTPLVGAYVDRSHSSGGAYLEECVRETIFSELMNAELPGGAIPTIAIIETGEIQVWDTDLGPKIERRCLLVRPCFLRPAHFERAPGFVTLNPKEGFCDNHRVISMFERSIELFGRDELVEEFNRFWLQWARQLAYGYIHRLAHGGVTTSNICLDGRLLDFGGSASMPSWAQISVMLGAPPTGSEIQSVEAGLGSQLTFLARHLDQSFAEQEKVAGILISIRDQYEKFMCQEFLRVVGFTREQVGYLLKGTQAADLIGAVRRTIADYRARHFAIFEKSENPLIRWDIERVWHDPVPPHLVELARLVHSCLQLLSDRESGQISVEALGETTRRRCQVRSEGRPSLYRETVKEFIYCETDGPRGSGGPAMNELSNFIDALVNTNRRDSIHDFSDAFPIGFARNSTSSYALFESTIDGRIFAIDERDEGSRNGRSTQRIQISSTSTKKIVFVDRSRMPFEGHVRIVAH